MTVNTWQYTLQMIHHSLSESVTLNLLSSSQWAFNNWGNVIFRDLCPMAIFGFKWVLNNLTVSSVDWVGYTLICMPLLFPFNAFEEWFKLWYGPLCGSLLNSSDAIFSALYDGSGVIEILRGHEYLSHPFAVSLYGGNVYWTDWRTNTLARANKWTGQNVTVIQKTSAQPFDLQIFHPSRQPQGENSYSGFPAYGMPLIEKRLFTM